MNANRQKILEYIRRCDYSPTVREIALAVGISPGTAQYHLERLERSGEIERSGKRIVVKA